jgi:hypothetical protein
MKEREHYRKGRLSSLKTLPASAEKSFDSSMAFYHCGVAVVTECHEHG